MLDIVEIPLLGIIPESPDVLKASKVGTSIVLDEPCRAGTAYEDAVARLIGEQVEIRLQSDDRPGLLQRLFRRTA